MYFLLADWQKFKSVVISNGGGSEELNIILHCWQEGELLQPFVIITMEVI